jgi:hypothetical protein
MICLFDSLQLPSTKNRYHPPVLKLSTIELSAKAMEDDMPSRDRCSHDSMSVLPDLIQRRNKRKGIDSIAAFHRTSRCVCS